jgi:hypothetical protein
MVVQSITYRLESGEVVLPANEKHGRPDDPIDDTPAATTILSELVPIDGVTGTFSPNGTLQMSQKYWGSVVSEIAMSRKP